MLEQSYYDEADKIIAAYGTEPRFLIPIIQDIQSEYKYLPPELLRYVADKLNIAEAKAYSVATFYENFSFDAKGKFILKVCDGQHTHAPSRHVVAFAHGVVMFTLETVSCLGACGLAPVMTVNDVVHPAMTPEKVTALIAELKEGADE